MASRTLKIGIDIHGVIDANPYFFSYFSERLFKSGHQVHIITGAKWTVELAEKLSREYEIYWSHFHSITDYNERKGVPIYYKDPNHPWMDQDIWDSTKARICKENKIDIHIDDSEVYGQWFKTLKIPTIYVLVQKASI